MTVHVNTEHRIVNVQHNIDYTRTFTRLSTLNTLEHSCHMFTQNTLEHSAHRINNEHIQHMLKRQYG